MTHPLYFGKGFRSFHMCNIRSVGQRASKLLAVKLRFSKKSAASGIQAKLCASTFGPELSSPGVESFSKFDSQ